LAKASLPGIGNGLVEQLRIRVKTVLPHRLLCHSPERQCFLLLERLGFEYLQRLLFAVPAIYDFPFQNRSDKTRF
jgi:hypothetical protein